MYPTRPQLSSDQAHKLTQSQLRGKWDADAGISVDKDWDRKTKENDRELATHANANWNVSVSELEERAKKGKPTEISGDALARAKKGQTPKYHRS